MSSRRNHKKKYVSHISGESFKQLARNNVKKSINDYAVYFITLAFGVALLYSFNALDDTLSLLNGNRILDSSIYMSRGILATFSIVICIIFGFLIAYSNNFIMKKRKKEFSIYITLGMDKRDINKLMFRETVVIGLLSLVVGLFIGILSSQGLGMIATKMLTVSSLDFKFSFSFVSTIKTIVFFVLVLLIVNHFNKKNMLKYNLIDLINSHKKNEYSTSPGRASNLILFTLSIICTIASYIVFFTTDPRTSLGYIMVFTTGIILLIIGTYLFFLSVSDFIIISLKKVKKIYYNNLNIFIINQLSSRIKTISSSLTAICLLLLISMIIMPFGMTMGKYLIKDLESLTPYDASITRLYISPNNSDRVYSTENKSVDKYTSLESELLENNENLDKLVANTSEIKIYKFKNITLNNFGLDNNFEPLNVIGISDYNSVRKQRGLNEINLSNNEFLINYDIKEYKQVYENYMKINQKPININDNLLKLKDSKLYNLTYSSNVNATDFGTIIVPDIVLDNLNPTMTILNVNYTESNNNYDNMFLDAFYNIKDNSNNYEYMLDQKLVIDGEKIALNTTFSFIAVYLGIILLISSGAVLALQQLSESTSNKEKFNLLRKLGIKKKDRKKAIFMQVLTIFITPLSLAILHSLFVTKLIYVMIPELIDVGILRNMLLSIVIVILMYSIYLCMSYFQSLNIINSNKNKTI